MPYVYSTLATDMKYINYNEILPNSQIRPSPVAEDKHPFILIKGGAGVAKIGGAVIETPLGTATQVSDDQLAVLKKNNVFQIHVKNKFILIDDKKMAIEKAVNRDMNPRDFSAPKTPKELSQKPKDGIK